MRQVNSACDTVDTSLRIWFLQVSICSNRACTSSVNHLGENAFCSLLAASSGPCSDQWRLQLLQIIHNACTVSAAQAAALLGCFETQTISDPAKMLLMSIHDVPNLTTFEHAVVDCSDACEGSVLATAYEQLGCPSAVLAAHNPSGHYHLDLTNQVCTFSIMHAGIRGASTGQCSCSVALTGRCSMQVHRITAVKCNHAQIAANILQDTVFPGSRPVVCRNVTITSPGSVRHVTHLYEALGYDNGSSTALHDQIPRAGSEKRRKEAASMPTEGILSFDLAQAGVGTVGNVAPSRRARRGVERSKALTEVVVLGWQDMPFMATEEEDAVNTSGKADRRTGVVAALIVQVAHVCAGNNNTTLEKVLESLRSEQEILVRFLWIELSSTSLLVFSM